MGENKELEWPTLKTLEKGQKEFIANGNEYRVSQSLSFDRWKDMQTLQAELGTGFSIDALTTKLKEQRASLNKMDFVDAAIINHELMLGVAGVDTGRWPTALRICTLFVNRKGEDITTINEDLINEKIDDWRKEGYDMGSFFHLAFSSIPGFLSAYQTASQSSSPSRASLKSDNTSPSGSNP